MVRLPLDERQWQKVKAALGVRKRAGRPGRDDRKFVEAVLWWRRTGAPWRNLPSDFGQLKTAFKRFDRWVVQRKEVAATSRGEAALAS
jgi:transposase